VKRYIAIDITTMRESELSLIEWCILENVKFLTHEDKWCYATKKSLAKHHGLTERHFFRIRQDLELKGWLKSNKKGHLRVTKKWYDIMSDHDKMSYDKMSDDTMTKCPTLPIKEDILSVNNIYLVLKNKIKSVKSNFKPVNETLDKKHIKEAMQIDGRSEQELIGCINYIYTDKGSFWIPHILTGKKLREKFDTIEMQMMKPSGSSSLDKIMEEVEYEKNGSY